MKIFDKIKRRARDVIRAAKGEPWGELGQPVQFERIEAEVETYRVTGNTGHLSELIDNNTKDLIRRIEIKDAAARLGIGLLEDGLLKVEITENLDPLSLQLAREYNAFPGYAIALEAKVVKPEQREGVRE